MATADRHPDTKLRTLTDPPRLNLARPAAPPLTTFRLTWTLHAPELAAQHGADRDRDADVTIEVTVHDTEAAATLHIAARQIPLGRAPATWHYDPDTNLDHIDAPGLLCATLRLTDARATRPEARVIYARTPALTTLRIPGGRTDVPTLTIE